MKIAILSMQRIVNFGSVLQAYSLRELVREITGINADFLDIEDAPAIPSRRSIQEDIDYEAPAAYSKCIFQRVKRRIISKLSFCNKKLIKKFMADELCLNEHNSQNIYDHVIIGSDEVFNHTKGIRLQLHGDVKQAKHVFTYAASCGSARFEDISPQSVKVVQEAMRGLAAVSVRDSVTQIYAENLYDGEILRHLDPVLMGNLYRRTPKRVPLKKYLLIYAYGQRIRTIEEIDAIKSFAKEKGLKILAIGGSQFWCDLYLPVSPLRALDYFHYAEYVITDTFHGAIFSIINKRKFAVIVRKTNQGKLTALLEDLGLESQRLTDLSELTRTLEREIQYDAVDKILNHERERTRVYLKKQLRIEK